MINISTPRLIIRNFTPEDWRSLQQVIKDKESSKFAYTDHPFPTGNKEVQDIANWFAKGDSFLAVEERTAKKVIGYIAINSEGEGVHNLGYSFLNDYRGQGHATDACTAVINYVFYNLKAVKFTCGTAVNNTPSCRLLEKLGFRKTAEQITSFRQDEKGKPIEFTGAVFGLNRDSWTQIKHDPV